MTNWPTGYWWTRRSRIQSRSHAGMVKLPPRVRVNDGDILLAVIHGFGFNGWRDDQATQTYVLKNAAGAGMRTEARQQVVRPDTQDKLPRIRGDVIAQSIGGAVRVPLLQRGQVRLVRSAHLQAGRAGPDGPRQDTRDDAVAGKARSFSVSSSLRVFVVR